MASLINKKNAPRRGAHFPADGGAWRRVNRGPLVHLPGPGRQVSRLRRPIIVLPRRGSLPSFPSFSTVDVSPPPPPFPFCLARARAEKVACAAREYNVDDISPAYHFIRRMWKSGQAISRGAAREIAPYGADTSVLPPPSRDMFLCALSRGGVVSRVDARLSPWIKPAVL